MLKISQSLIKEVLKQDHCPKQIYYSFVEGKELIDPSENMLQGRYFESEILGACRGGEKQEAKLIRGGEKAKPYRDVDELIVFANEVVKNLGIDVSKGESQLRVESDTLLANIDHRNKDLLDPGKMANYDWKLTLTKEDDRWNGWGNVENDINSEIQAVHYTLTTYEETGEYWPFYFLVFGLNKGNKWVRVIRFQITYEALENHKQRISYTSSLIREYAENNYKGNGNFNKCISCPFYDICEDKSTTIDIETIVV